MKADERMRKVSSDQACCCRREFLQTAGTAAGALAFLSAGTVVAGESGPAGPRVKKTPTVLGAFIYNPTEQLKKKGYWSWPGSSFDPEGHQRAYAPKVDHLARQLNMQIRMEPKPLDTGQAVSRFVDQVKRTQPDGLLLFLFKKWLNNYAERIVKETGIPAVVSTPLGTLLLGSIRGWQHRNGVHLINADQDFGAVEDGMRMIRTARWMKDARLINLRGKQTQQAEVPSLGTQVRTVPLARFVEAFRDVGTSPDVKRLALAYQSQAQEIVEPSPEDIRDAARTYFALKRILKDEHGDALMMQCLGGLKKPHKHVPPCMGFMSLHNEGIVAGCQADLEPTLTMMLGYQLLGQPGFMHNPSWNTVTNHYFGAHCTAPSKMNGPDTEAQPYILRSHNEAGWGCVPQVLFPAGQPVTMAHYFPKKEPQMSIYGGQVVRCYPKLPGGCRTNFEMEIDGVEDASQLVSAGHQVIFFGNHGRRLEAFCKLYGIKVIGS